MPLFHSTEPFSTSEAQITASQHRQAVEAAGGRIEAPGAPVQSPAILVLELPEGIQPQDVVQGVNFVPVQEEEAHG